jgi:Phospholipid-translocating ATPase N-terminal
MSTTSSNEPRLSLDGDNLQTTARASTPSPRPQLHIETATVQRRPSATSTPPRSRDGRRPSFNEFIPPLSSTPSIRSQRSDQPRVRFSSDVQTMGDRAIVSPSITAEEALARLQAGPNQPNVVARAGSIGSGEPIKGILRSPGQSLPESVPQRVGRPRGWSLRRQLWLKQGVVGQPTPGSNEIGMAVLPTLVARPEALPAEPRTSDVDAIRVVNSALDQARVDPPVISLEPKTSMSTKPSMIQPEATQASLPFYSTWAASRQTRHMLVEKCREVMRVIKRMRDPRLTLKGHGREIPINVPERGKTHLIDERTGRDFCDNLITSSRYTIYSFLPRQLWAQFSKVANL